MKTIRYQGYTYWLLMILGALFGNIIDEAHWNLLFPVILIIAFAIFGDMISQIIMWSKLHQAPNLKTIKHYRNLLLIFAIVWMIILLLPTIAESFLHELYVISIVELLLLVLLLVNKIRWMAFQLKNWTTLHNSKN
ncbi:MAG: hypothetical protein IAA89_04340 [Firmicutes bacterium]|uniref:Uncharacterized protein n=1 Tax=Candidatus Gallilactobacillus intestinavium TaxID=2840838 RepID=A0A9D9E674_9LACO|nr:hypothetical protein [Candidatus Gallilactobacillus intestinavium]